MFPCTVTFQFLYNNIPLNRDGAVVKNPPVSAGDVRGSGSVPGLGRCPGGGNVSPFQYSCLRYSWTEEPGGFTVHRVTKSWTWLGNWASTEPFYSCAWRSHLMFAIVNNREMNIIMDTLYTKYFVISMEPLFTSYLWTSPRKTNTQRNRMGHPIEQFC